MEAQVQSRSALASTRARRETRVAASSSIFTSCAFAEPLSAHEQGWDKEITETKGEKIQFRIVDPPQVPTLPSGPPRLILMSAVLAAALGAGVVIAFLMSQLGMK